MGADDGHRIPVYYWLPRTQPRGIVQILHGLSEHAARYERFANACIEQGFAVVAHDHRGHGGSCPADKLGHFADVGGWDKVAGDVLTVNAAARARFAGMPLVLFAHSMGSYIGQFFAMCHPGSIDALILSGSTSAPRIRLYLGQLAARLEIARHGKTYRSPALNRQAFGAFNNHFRPARTGFDWLSRDAREVDRYVTDPLCGRTPGAQLWHDLLGGMIGIGRKSALRQVPADLPVLITGGSDDPVGGRRGMQRLAALWSGTGHRNVTLKVFDGGRHEMLNETSRNEFTRFVTGWASKAIV